MIKEEKTHLFLLKNTFFSTCLQSLCSVYSEGYTVMISAICNLHTILEFKVDFFLGRPLISKIFILGVDQHMIHLG